MAMRMLDTNMVSAIVTRRSVKALEIFRSYPQDQLCVSAVTAGELLYGLAKVPEATKLNAVLRAFLADIEILPWTAATAAAYAKVRAAVEKNGRPLGALDTMIAAHAIEAAAVLATADKAFGNVEGLSTENWAA
jgi:tRNA(fMet)-specific endonuclease VapC